MLQGKPFLGPACNVNRDYRGTESAANHCRCSSNLRTISFMAETESLRTHLEAMMQMLRSLVLLAAVSLAIGTSGSGALAQSGPGGLVNPQRDCQTVLQCRFERGGVYRGCISAYSCRRCRFVRARCSSDARRPTCRRLRCTWG